MRLTLEKSVWNVRKNARNANPRHHSDIVLVK